MNRATLQNVFFLALLIAVIALTLALFSPYFLTLATATTFAVVLQPVYRRITVLVRGQRSIASIITIVFLGIVLLVPIFFVGRQVVREAQDLYVMISANPNISFDLLAKIETYVQQYVPGVTLDLSRYAGQAVSWIAGNIGGLFTGTIATAFNLLLGIIALYYLLKDGGKFVHILADLSPLAEKYDMKISSQLETAINSIIRGSLLVALLQGLSTGIGLTIFGVPSPALWGSLAAMGALVPGVGTAIVITPAILYLYFADRTGAALGLLLWGLVAVGMIDNLLGPLFIGRGIRIHPFLVLLAVLGGITLFGPLGILLGPLILSLLIALIDIYRKLILKGKEPA